ncbi:MAG TPA: hypothetical protein VFX11_03730 [Candidatus Kapabacteria bacterium]|nr:hypothetical protein [Candidatus Kapabacteria bacterium]
MKCRRSQRHPFGRNLLLVVAGGLLSISAHAATLAGDCHPARRLTCTLPFPSDLFAEEDAQSPTGKRVIIPNSALALLRNETQNKPVLLPESVRPEGLFQDASGFSAGAPVLFELDRAVNESTLPFDGGLALLVFEIGGDDVPVPVNVRVMEVARGQRAARKDVVIEAWPRARFTFGKSYVAALTRAVKPLMGTDFAPAPVLAGILAGQPSPLTAAYAPALTTLDARLASRGLTRADILDLTFFTVRDEAEVVQPIGRFMQRAYADAHPLKRLSVEYFPYQTIAAVVTGLVRLTDFRAADGNLVRDPDYPGTENWVEFRFAIPRDVRLASAPVVIYGHGLASKKEDAGYTEKLNALRNIATLSIDQPNHGYRGEFEGGGLFDILQPQDLGRVLGMVIQSSIDQVSLLAALEHEFRQLDVYPRNAKANVFPWLALRGQDQQNDLNLERIFYKGTSMGGVLGSAFIGAAPRLDGAFIHVPGVGVANIVSHSVVWALFGRAVPNGTVGAEIAAYLGMVQQGLDYGDGLNFAGYYRTGTDLLPYPVNPKPVSIEYGVGDGVVFNDSSVAMMEIAGMPLAHPHNPAIADHYDASPVPKLPDDVWFDDGYGAMPLESPRDPDARDPWVINLVSPYLNGWSTGSLAAHGAFRTDAGAAYEGAWTDTFIQKNPRDRQPESAP